MDYNKQTSYVRSLVLTLATLGCFVFVWFASALVGDHAPDSQIAQIHETLKKNHYNASDSYESMIDWMASVMRDQQKTIQALVAENTDMALDLASTTRSLESEEREALEVERDKPHVLVVVGHTADTKGAAHGNLSEYELNYQLTEQLQSYLAQAGYRVTTSHHEDHYTEEFQDYFEKNKEIILQFRKDKKDAYEQKYPQGVVTNDTDHNYASSEAVVQLYGINMWANQNDVDAVIHIHFNDYPGRKAGLQGEHTGFSVFTSLKTNRNFLESFRLAKYIEQEMLKYTSRSTVRAESAGVLESELIAVGQANSVDVPAVLLEGGFIYEPKFINPNQRTKEVARYARALRDALDGYFQYNTQ